ncbi:ras-GEF domain-containing family member 1B-like, partial [Drosophila navojoa]
MRPHELLGKLLASVTEGKCLETLVALLAEWTQKFPYDYRDERMMNHVKHIVARCSNSHLEAIVSQVLSALLQRLTDLEQHEADLRACQTNSDKVVAPLNCPTATQYAQILCRLEKKLAKHIGPEEFVQCSSMVLLDKQ